MCIRDSSRSGGAFNFYGALKGDRVYTIYINTVAGTAVMQYADPASSPHPYAEDLTAPDPLHADLPAGILRSRVVIACLLDRSCAIRNAQVLESANAKTTDRMMEALPKRKLRPMLSGDKPVEVNDIQE